MWQCQVQHLKRAGSEQTFTAFRVGYYCSKQSWSRNESSPSQSSRATRGQSTPTAALHSDHGCSTDNGWFSQKSDPLSCSITQCVCRLHSSHPKNLCVGLCATNSNSGIASALLRPYSDTLHSSRGRSVCFCRAAVPQSTAWWASNSLAAVSVCWHTAIPCSIRMLQQCTIVQKTIAQSPSTLQSNKPC